ARIHIGGDRDLLRGFRRRHAAGQILGQLIYIGHYFGHGRVQRGGNLLPYLGVLIERTRQRRTFPHRHPVLPCERAAIGGDQLHPFGHDLRCRHILVVVLERHGIVGRVGHDHIGGRYILHHAAPRHVHLLATDTSLDLGAAFLLL